MMEINIAGNPVAYLNGLGKYTQLAIAEQTSKAGEIAVKSIRGEFDKATTEWSKEYEDGKLKAFKQHSKLGMRLSHENKKTDNPDSMRSFIQHFTMVSSGTTVIMGAHKAHRPLTIQNGEVVGYEKKQSTITRSTIAILEKLNSGKKSRLYKSKFPEGSVRGQFKGNQKYKQRNWAEAGMAKAHAQVKTEMTSKLATLIANYELQRVTTA
jgi:hypothetical protein